jgi:WD40 repeat protein
MGSKVSNKKEKGTEFPTNRANNHNGTKSWISSTIARIKKFLNSTQQKTPLKKEMNRLDDNLVAVIDSFSPAAWDFSNPSQSENNEFDHFIIMPDVSLVAETGGEINTYICAGIIQQKSLAVLICDRHRQIISTWNIKTGQHIDKVLESNSDIWCGKVLDDGSLAIGLANNRVEIWDITKNHILHTMEGHSDGVSHIHQLFNGNIVTGSHDNNVKIWDVRDKSLLDTFRGHEVGITGIASNNHDMIVSCSWDGTVISWNTHNGTIKCRFHVSRIECLDILPNGNIITGSCKNVKIWKTNTCIATIMKNNFISSLHVLRDGNLKVATGTNVKSLDFSSKFPFK